MRRRRSDIRVTVWGMVLGMLLTVGLVPTGASAATRRSATAKSSTTVKKSTPSRTRQPRYTRSSRRARLARLAAAKRTRELREVQSPLFRQASDGSVVPDVRAEAAVIYNPTTGEVLWEENADNERSIASITKVMTAVVFLEHDVDPAREVIVDPIDMRGASTTYLRSKERVRVDDLMHLLLIGSDNGAARTLARVSPYGPGFVDRMNQKAVELGLTHTRYADPSGLNAGNVSTALDMARLIAFAAGDERIAALMRKREHQLTISRRTITVHNTNRLVGSEIDVRGGKTGFIRAAGYCLATLLGVPDSNQQVAVVVLGARSNAGRFMETRHLFNWIATKTRGILGAVPQAQSQQ